MARRSLSHWESIVKESNEGVNIWVGVDVHKRSYSVAVLSDNGVIHTFRANADNQALLELFAARGVKITQLVYEAGPTGFCLARACQQVGVEVIVVAAGKIPRPAVAGPKNDAIDCIKLAQLAAKGMLKAIAIPTKQQQTRRGLLRRRMQVADDIRKAKQRIKSLLLFQGIDEPQGLANWSKAALEQLAALALDDDLRDHLDSLLRGLNSLKEEKNVLEQKIKRTLLPENDVLQTVPGVGPIISSAFRAEIFDAKRFNCAEQLSSFLGLAPCIRQSGDTKSKARLMPSGQKQLRALLVEACWVLKRHETWAEVFYQRIRRRSANFQQAISALARKLGVLLWRLLLENRPYQSDYNHGQ